MRTPRQGKEPVTNPSAIMARLSKYLSLSEPKDILAMNPRISNISLLWRNPKMAKPMTEQKAKKQLARMLQSFTTGSILHLLSDHLTEEMQKHEPEKSQQLQLVQSALIVVGVGIDSILPS